MNSRWAVPLLLVAVTAACFLPALSGEFVNWDDDANFLENPNYRGLSPAHLRWMFTTNHMGNYQPLTWLTLGADYLVWGMNAGGYHFTNLVLHIASTILFYFFLLLLMERIGPEGPATRWAAAIGALFFAIHPLRVESVAWATERKGVLCMMFVMVSLVAYLRMDREERQGRSGRRWLALSVAMFVCSLFSKALALTLPVALLALDVYPLRRFVVGRRGPVLLEKVPYLVASLVAGVATLSAVQSAGVARSAQQIDLLARVEEASYGITFYIWKTLLPFGLSPLYPASRPENFNPLAPMLLVGVAVTALLFSAAVVLRRRHPAPAVAFFCYALLLLPVLRLNFEAPQLVADRYAYLACLPWAALLAVALERSARPALLASAGVLLVLGGLSIRQTFVWKDSIALWTQALKVDDTNAFAYNNRGAARSVKNDRAGAIDDFSQAIRLDPGFSDALTNRGRMRMLAGDFDGAIADHGEAIRRTPLYAAAWQNRAAARQAKGDVEGARADLAEAVRLGAPRAYTDNTAVRALVNDGVARAAKGDLDGAIARFTEAIRLDPKIAAIYYNRATARISKGDDPGAVADFTEALKLDAKYREAYVDRADSRFRLNDFRGAVEDYTEALKIQPRDPSVLAKRGIPRAKLGDRPGAAEDFQQALALAPANWPQRATVQTLLARVRGR